MMKLVSLIAACTLVLAPLEPSTAEVDADLVAAMEDAEHALSQQQSDRAYAIVVGVFSSSDPFSIAQSPVLGSQGASLLRRVGEEELSRGHLTLGAQALDAAWELDGRPQDPRYAAVLTQWAQDVRREDKATALYLARRALVVDPDNAEAAALDRRLSRNPLRAPGWTALSLSLATLVASIAAASAASDASGATATRYRRLAGAGFGTTAGLYLLGIGLLWGGKRNYAPTSPKQLPAFDEGSVRERLAAP